MLPTSTVLLLIAHFAILNAFSIKGEQKSTVNPEKSWSCMSVKECLQAGGQIEDSDKCECPTIYCNHVATTVQPSEGSSSTTSSPSLTSASAASPSTMSPTSPSSASPTTSTFPSTSPPSSPTPSPDIPTLASADEGDAPKERESDICEVFNCMFNEELCFQLNGVLKESNHGCPHQDQKCCLWADMASELY
ncbi:putative protein TPRXL [Photinus pyralis]|nr:putative protein TPRXL [Photinus pyralis]